MIIIGVIFVIFIIFGAMKLSWKHFIWIVEGSFLFAVIVAAIEKMNS